MLEFCETVKAQVIEQVSGQFRLEIDTLLHKYEDYVNNSVLENAIPMRDGNQLVFENTAIKEVSRIVSPSGNVYLVVELQDTSDEVLLLNETRLDESAIQYLRSFMPVTNNIEDVIERMDQESAQNRNFMADLEIQIAQVVEEKDAIQAQID